MREYHSETVGSITWHMCIWTLLGIIRIILRLATLQLLEHFP